MGIEGRVSGLYSGGEQGGLEKVPYASLQVNFQGIVDDRHAGFTKAADSRNPQYLRGSEMRNGRQWSAVSPNELAMIAELMGIPEIDAGWLGANLALTGIPNLTRLPRGSKLTFPEDAVLLVESENKPCIGPGETIATKYPNYDLRASIFPKAAIGRRGLVGVVEREGVIRLEDVVAVTIYEPKAYSLPPNLKPARRMSKASIDLEATEDSVSTPLHFDPERNKFDRLPDNLPEEFGPWLRAYRDRLGVSNTVLANRSGVSPGYINLLINHSSRNPSIPVIYRIATILHLNQGELEHLLVLAGHTT